MKQNAKPKPAPRRSWFARFLIFGSLFIAVTGICAAIGLVAVYYHFSADLPQITSLKDYRPPVITTVYDDRNRVVAEFFKERRIVTPLSDMPELLIKAFIAAEDSRFFEHPGVDLISILRAAIKNVEAGAVVQGGSTITQQVTKSFLLTPEKTFRRKIREAILAYRIDQTLTKEEILFLYLNQIYLGHGAYGVAAAAENYFGKAVGELTLAECAILAGLPQAPSRYSPYRNFQRAKDRQRYVLTRMTEEGYITSEMANDAHAMALQIQGRENLYLAQAPYYTEHVRQYVVEHYGEEMLYTGGLKIHTALNIEMQRAARLAIEKGLRELDQRHSAYRGPIRRLAPEEIPAFLTSLGEDIAASPPAAGRRIPGVVEAIDAKKKAVSVDLGAGHKGRISFKSLDWALRKVKGNHAADRVGRILAPGDVIWAVPEKADETGSGWRMTLDQLPETQSALLCMESGTGYVKAMVGGKDFAESQFNRAVQSRRQPGSAFKPLIYAAAIEKGYTPASEIVDNVFIYKGPNMTWKPKNYDRKFAGHVLLRDALTHSRNLSTINLLNEIGVDYAVDYAERLGITSDISRNLSIALGSSGVSLLELVTAYSVFANQGYRISPVFITRILDREGNELEGIRMENERVIDAGNAFLVTSLMESVIQNGTGRRARALNRPAAGKTGTTNDLNDAWFVGFTTDFIAGAWVGYDEKRSLGSKETGGRAALPIWLDFMQTVHADRPVRGFSPPPGIVFSKIDADTGLLPVAESKHTIFECFKEGTVPTRYTRRSDTISDKEQFFKTDM